MKAGALLMMLLAGVAAAAAGPRPLDLATIDVCALVPGDEVAHAVSASLREAKRFNSPDGDIARCVYIVEPAGSEGTQPRAFAVELEPASNFAELRPFVEEPTHDVGGLGDGAWTSRDPDTGRFRLWVLRGGTATLYLTADDETELRKIAELVLSKL